MRIKFNANSLQQMEELCTYCHYSTANSALLIAKFTLLKARRGAAKRLGLRLWFFNSDLSQT